MPIILNINDDRKINQVKIHEMEYYNTMYKHLFIRNKSKIKKKMHK